MGVIKVREKGIIILPKDIREKAGIYAGTILEVLIDDGKIIRKPMNLWEKVWGSGKG